MSRDMEILSTENELNMTVSSDRNPLSEVLGKRSFNDDGDDQPRFASRKNLNGTRIHAFPPVFGDCISSEFITSQHTDESQKTVPKNGNNGLRSESRSLRGYNPSRGRKPKVKFLDWRLVAEDKSHVHGRKPANKQSTDPQFEIMSRDRVMKAVSLYNQKYRLLKERKLKFEDSMSLSSLSSKAAKMVKKEMKWSNNEKIIGPVPGVRVGDWFDFRAPLCIIGLHSRHVVGIDYKEEDGRPLAISIVDSNRYKLAFGLHTDQRELSYDVLYYIGQGGNTQVGHTKIEDQKLEGGNKALMNSIKAKNEVRVIRKLQRLDDSERKWVYVYLGLYTVEHCTQERGDHGKLAFIFELKRKPGQPEVDSDRVYRPIKFAGCSEPVDNSSQRKEKPVRDLDHDEPTYYECSREEENPNSSKPETSGYDRVDGCVDLTECSRVIRNGEKVPFDEDVRPVIHECDPSYKCPPSGKNRVRQQVLKCKLEIFKKRYKGWAVRSRDFIKRGRFICSFPGMLVQDEEDRKRTADDHGDERNGTGGDTEFRIDAAESCNVGRFIKYSNSPNLFAQSVIYDDEDKKVPHIRLYASEIIIPNQELTLNYRIL